MAKRYFTQVKKMIFVRMTAINHGHSHRGSRDRSHPAPTVAAAKKYNMMMSRIKAQILVSANFSYGDWFIMFSYDDPEPSAKDAHRELDNFKRRLARLYRKHKIKLKWISTTEYGKEAGRIHHHMIISGGVPVEEIIKKWGKGFVRCTPFNSDDDRRPLGSYIAKETEKRADDPERAGYKRWTCSTNIIRPRELQEEISEREFDNPKIPDRYYIDKDSIIEGINPVTGRPYKLYVLKLLDPQDDRRYWKLKTLRAAPHERDEVRRWLIENTPVQTDLFCALSDGYERENLR